MAAQHPRRQPSKPTPIEAFELNMADAQLMVDLAEALANQRKKAMYVQKRERIGAALRMTKREIAAIDCVESDDLFVVIKKDSKLTRGSLQDLSAILRHSIVAANAAAETYFGDKVVELVRPLLHSHNTVDLGFVPERLRAIPLNLGDLLAIDNKYETKRRGVTETVVVPFIEERASVNPGALGEVLGLAGHKGFFKKVDVALERDDWTESRMLEISQRRNRIAHSADRAGRGRAPITVRETRRIIDDLTTIVRVADTILVPIERPSESDADRIYAAVKKTKGQPFVSAEIASACSCLTSTVASYLSKWAAEGFDDDRFLGVGRVERGVYQFDRKRSRPN